MYLTLPDISSLLSFNGPFTDKEELMKGVSVTPECSVKASQLTECC